MRTIINVGLGLALAFCLVFFVSGSFEEYVDAKVETAVAEYLSQIVVEEQAEQPSANIDELVESAVTKAVAKVKKEMKVTTKTVAQVPAATPKTTTAKPADNRVWIDVRGPKGAVKLYVGQPKEEVLQILGTPDSYNFGGKYEDCSYTVGKAIIPNLKIDFESGKLKRVTKYDI